MIMKSRGRQRVSRVPNACEECKRRKIKCTGKNPCESCIARRITCVFKSATKKILVSESYLLALQNRQTIHSGEDRTKQSNRESLTPTSSSSPEAVAKIPETTGEKSSPERITNPLVSPTSFYLQDSTGRYRFCGPSSTWGFSQRVFLALKSAIPDYPSPNLPFHVDGSTWKLNWTRTSEANSTFLEGLPSLDDFMFLFNSIKFHSHLMIVLLDEEEFFPHLDEFYQNGLEKVKTSPLWFIQYLLLIALSKACAGTSNHADSPPGHVFFERAMSLMPDFVGLHRQPNLAMQILYLAALFLLTVDMKDAAYAYISQSIRMCVLEGLNNEPPSEIFGCHFATQCRDIWWSAYILDRQLSAVIGAPISIQDSQISCTLPSSYKDSEHAEFMTMHIKLAKIVGQILGSVYGAVNRQKRSFTVTIQIVLREMAQILQEIEDLTSSKHHTSFSVISTRNCHLYLTYHQCIILATRPLFLHFLHRRMDKSSYEDQRADDLNSSHLRPLLEASLQSAKFSVRIFLMLHEQSSSVPLFPFGLENIFSSAFVIVIAHFIDPSLVLDMQQYVNNVTHILADLSGKNNATAGIRQKELHLLQDMLKEITGRENRPIDNPIPFTPEMPHTLSNFTPYDSIDEWVGTMEDISLSHTQILSLAQQLDDLDGTDLDINFGFGNNDTWL